MTSNYYINALILIVDANEDARNTKSRTLISADFQVMEASNAHDALAMIRTERPNLILLDVNLPDMSGLDLCRQLKGDPKTRTMLILQTASSFVATSSNVNGIDSCADNYLMGSIGPDQLIANVNVLLRLGRAERELRDVDLQKDQFLSTLAHELRNPLGAIRNAVALMRRTDLMTPQAQEKSCNIIERQTDHLVGFIDDLLEAAPRIAREKISLTLERIELKTFINNAIAASSPFIKGRHHVLAVNLPEEDIWIKGDQIRLTQIMSNLLLNAEKFTESGAQINLTAKSAGHSVIISLSNDVIDSPEAIIKRFTPTKRSVEQLTDGFGIGLSLIRTLVELHGGKIRAYNPQEGQSNMFEISLPIDATEAKQPEQKSIALDQDAPKRVLIVDDNVDVVTTLSQWLKIGGYDVRTAYNGAQAIESTADFKPQIVLLDIGLPDLNGYDIALELRKLPDIPNFLLVAVTGYGQGSDGKEFLDAGFDRHFAKPMDLSKLGSIGLHV